MEEKRVWGIHTSDDHLFLDKNLIAISWSAMGNLSLIEADREAFKEKFKLTYPETKPQAIPTSAGMLFRFVHEMQVGDYIVFPSKFNRKINIGIVEGEYMYDESSLHYVQRRKVKWIKHLPRTAFSQGALYEAGSALTLFMIKNYADEYIAALEKSGKKIEIVADDAEVVEKTTQDIIESTKDYILKELSKNLKGYELEDFVADLLHSMGYRVIVSSRGGDRGIDITA